MYIITSFLFGKMTLPLAPEREGRNGSATLAPLLLKKYLREIFIAYNRFGFGFAWQLD
jgi:hypothetical protein